MLKNKMRVKKIKNAVQIFRTLANKGQQKYQQFLNFKENHL